MTIHLPEDLEHYVQSEVQRGQFAWPNQAITESSQLLRQKKQEAKTQAKAHTPDKLDRQLLESGLLIHIPTRPANQRGQVVRRPSPAGDCQLPTAELRQIRGPISPTKPSLRLITVGEYRNTEIATGFCNR
jgi:Arc/MetJ-type ribon-helix-helix transcriptional regulator